MSILSADLMYIMTTACTWDLLYEFLSLSWKLTTFAVAFCSAYPRPLPRNVAECVLNIVCRHLVKICWLHVLTSDMCLLGVAYVALSEDGRRLKHLDPLTCDAATVSLSLEFIPGDVRSV